MEGFWTVQFQGVQGMGAGVITLVGGQLFGGDSSFLYKGTYAEQGNTLTAQVQVNRYAAGMARKLWKAHRDDSRSTASIQRHHY